MRTKYTQCRETVVEVLGLVEDEWDSRRGSSRTSWTICIDHRWVVALPRQTIRKESTK